MTQTNYEFDGYILDRQRIELRRDGQVVLKAGVKLRCLLYLIENRDRVVTKANLMVPVWENEFVEENAIQRAISDLRKALRNSRLERYKYIATEPGRGYKFVSHVVEVFPDAVQTRQFQSDDDSKSISSDDDSESIPDENSPLKKHSKYVYFNSFFYGTLFLIAVLMATAYRLEDFGAISWTLGLTLSLLNGGILAFSMKLTRVLIDKDWSNAVIPGSIVLISTSLLVSPAIASFFLPLEALNPFQSLSAIVLFSLNCIYFTGLSVIYIFGPFYYRSIQLRRFAEPDKRVIYFWQRGKAVLQPQILLRAWAVLAWGIWPITFSSYCRTCNRRIRLCMPYSRPLEHLYFSESAFTA